MEDSLDAWFKREILVHEAALVRFLNRWPNRHEVHDLRQEVYIRVYEAAAKARPTISPKTFLFQTARNLLIDRVRRGRIVSIEAVADLDCQRRLNFDPPSTENAEVKLTHPGTCY